VTRRWIAAAVLVVVLAVGGVLGWRTYHRGPAPAGEVAQDDGEADEGEVGGNDVETVATAQTALPTGGTPMAERVAVVGLLNKRNGVSRELTMHPGQALRVGDVVVRVRACEQTAPWENEALTGVFAQLDVRGVDTHWRRAFSGWLYKERPALNVVQHPVYDVWAKSCTMSWPATGADTETLAAPAARSSAKKSPGGGDGADDGADTPATPASAPDNNAT
jgi:hypothetical protein